MKTIQRLRLDSFLSFAPGSEAIELEPLNVLIGPNGAGKSNVIEAIAASARMQLIVTTHSDALISELTGQPEAVLTCERPGEGTVLRRLDPERLSSWLDEYRLGDLWRMGELGANP